jgi:hypothetical protein
MIVSTNIQKGNLPQTPTGFTTTTGIPLGTSWIPERKLWNKLQNGEVSDDGKIIRHEQVLGIKS